MILCMNYLFKGFFIFLFKYLVWILVLIKLMGILVFIYFKLFLYKVIKIEKYLK